jgi:hypothetical protein
VRGKTKSAGFERSIALLISPSKHMLEKGIAMAAP